MRPSILPVTALLLLATCLTTGCEPQTSRSEQAGAAAIAPHASPHSAPVAGPLTITIDGHEASAPRHARVLREAVADTPPATWRSVRVEARGGRSFELPEPAARHPDARFELSRDPRGALTVALRKPIDAALPATVRAAARRPIAALSDVTAIRIRTTRAEPPEPPSVAIVVEAGGETHTLTDLSKLDEVFARRGLDRGYGLTSIVASVTDTNSVSLVTLIGMNGEQLVIGHDALVDPRQVLMLRVNRRGALRFRHYERQPGDKAKMLRRLRDVQKVIVTTSEAVDT